MITLLCRIVIAVCAEIIHHINPEEELLEEDFGPRIYWAEKQKLSDD